MRRNSSHPDNEWLLPPHYVRLCFYHVLHLAFSQWYSLLDGGHHLGGHTKFIRVYENVFILEQHILRNGLDEMKYTVPTVQLGSTVLWVPMCTEGWTWRNSKFLHCQLLRHVWFQVVRVKHDDWNLDENTTKHARASADDEKVGQISSSCSNCSCHT